MAGNVADLSMRQIAVLFLDSDWTKAKAMLYRIVDEVQAQRWPLPSGYSMDNLDELKWLFRC
jgi:hypothetical protein